MEMVDDEIHEHLISDLGFMNEANFDQFIHLIRRENDQTHDFHNNNNNEDEEEHNYEPINNINGFTDNIVDDGQFFQANDLFVADHSIVSKLLPNNICDQHMFDDDHRQKILTAENESSATTTNRAAKKNKNHKVDRSRTLISERKRRGQMKEKLYALRSLVPNITKMDKASIIGDAALYMQDLQMQAKKLTAEISDLESSFKNINGATQNAKKTNATSFCPIIKKIFKIGVVQVEAKGFYVRIVSNKGKGVAVSLFRALESFSSFNVQTSNLAASHENYILAFTLHILEEGMAINLRKLELLIASVFLNQGFEFEKSQSA